MNSGLKPGGDFHQMMVNEGLYQAKVTCGSIECDTSLGEYCHRGLGECRPCSDSCGTDHETKPSPNCLQHCRDWLIELVHKKYYEDQMQMAAASKPPTSAMPISDSCTFWPWIVLSVGVVAIIATFLILAVLLVRKKSANQGKGKVETPDIEMNVVACIPVVAENAANHHGDEGATDQSPLLHHENGAVDSSGYNSSRTPSQPDTPETPAYDRGAAQSSANLPDGSRHRVDLLHTDTGYPPSRQGRSHVSTPTQARPKTPDFVSQRESPVRGSAARIDQNGSRLHQAARDSAIESSNSLELELESTRGANQTTAQVHQPDSAREYGSERLQQPSYHPPYPETTYSNPA